MRNIILPKIQNSEFKRDSYKFIFILFVFVLLGFAYILDQFRDTMSTKRIIIKLLNMFTIAVPPSLPSALSISLLIS